MGAIIAASLSFLTQHEIRKSNGAYPDEICSSIFSYFLYIYYILQMLFARLYMHTCILIMINGCTNAT
jgi:hypothetical protein